VRPPLEPRPAAADAGLDAMRAAERAGVRVGELREIAGMHQAAALFIEIWRTAVEDAPCTPQLMRALSHSGNYVAGAWLDGRLVGAAVAFLHPGTDGLALHSHITGVSDAVQGRGVGLALKQHQRAWALAHGIARIDWTFDPLVRRNAHLNLVKLGAEIVEYLPHFYGRMPDGINAGDESDRCLVSWPLSSERAVAASHGPVPEPDLDALRRAGARVLLEEDPAGRPLTSDPGPPGAAAMLVQVPDDIVAIRGADPELARHWRAARRATMGEALGRGLAATGITRSGWYVLEDRSGRGEKESR
jgi:predicted GNAT superfamily acetyltransferase